MLNLIINADDFGFSKSVNEGIIHAYRQGLISTTTLMANMPNALEAIDLAKKNPGLGVGLHIVLTVGKPLSKNCPSLIDENGDFYNHKLLEKGSVNLNEAEVYEEILMQLKFLTDNGIRPDNIDAHHFLNWDGVIKKVIMQVAKELDLPVRKHFACDGIVSTDELFLGFYAENAKAETILDFIQEHPDMKSLEIMTHSGFIDEDTGARTSYLNRANEIKELEKLKEMGFYDSINLKTFQQL